MIVQDTFTVRGRGLCAVVKLEREPRLCDLVRNQRTGETLKILGIERDARPLKAGSVTALCFGDVDLAVGDKLDDCVP